MKTKNIFSPLKVREYRSLFSAQIFSDMGNWLDLIALQVIIVYNWNLNETAVAALIIALALPWVIVGPFTSVFVDRWSRKTVMVVCDLSRIVFVIGLIFAPNIYVLLVLVFGKGILGALFDPARQSTIKLTVPEEDLPQAVTLSQLSVNVMKIVGPALGGLCIATLGPRSPFIIEAIGFLISAFILMTLPSLKESNEDTDQSQIRVQKKSFWKEFKEGLSHIRHTTVLKLAISVSSVAFFLIFLYDGLLIYFAKSLGFNETSFGVLISAVGFGSVVGSLSAGQWTNWKKRPLSTMTLMMVIGGMITSIVGLGGMQLISFHDVVWILIAFLIGVLNSFSIIPYGFILQTETPSKLMGRVSSSAQSIQTFAMLLAPALGAILAEWIGVGAVMVLSGIGTLLLGSSVLIYVSRKKITVNKEAQASTSV
ncbi:MFS transporter [Bacillus timonensis]|nr:MFS transporter [Bacillus timonensis]